MPAKTQRVNKYSATKNDDKQQVVVRKRPPKADLEQVYSSVIEDEDQFSHQSELESSKSDTEDVQPQKIKLVKGSARRMKKKRERESGVKQQDVVQCHILKSVNKAVETMSMTQRQTVKECLEAGWASFDSNTKFLMKSRFLDENMKNDFKMWVQGQPKSDWLKDLNKIEVLELAFNVCQEDDQWLGDSAISVCEMIFEYLLDIDCIEELAQKVPVSLRSHLVFACQYYSDERQSVSWQHLTFTLELGFFIEMMKQLSQKFPFDRNFDCTTVTILTPPSKKSAYSAHFVYSLKKKYNSLSSQTIQMVLTKFEKLCHDGFLSQISKTHPLVQKIILDFYAKAVEGGEDSSQDAKTIISCINRKINVRKLIIEAAKRNEESLSAQEMANLFDQLPSRNDELVKKVLSKGLAHATTNIVRELVQASSVNFESQEMIDFYKVQTSQIVNQKIIESIDQISSDLQKCGGNYKKNVYQSAIAMRLIDQGQKFNAAQILPGDGKSFIFTKIACYHARQQQKVTIVVSDGLLLRQMSEYVDLYCDANFVRVTRIQNLTEEVAKDQVLLIDEADLVVDEYSIFFQKKGKKNQIGGLIVTTLAKRVYMLSAMFTTFHRHYFTQVLCMPKDALLVFKSLSELHTGKTSAIDFLISRSLVTSKEKADSVLVTMLAGWYQQHPIIVFISKDETIFDSLLESFCKRMGIHFAKVDSEEQAQSVRKSMHREEQGVVRVSRKFERGFDLKFATIAKVVLIINCRTVCYTDVLQMFGRGSRVQSQAQGAIIMWSEEGTKEQIEWESVRQRQKKQECETVRNQNHIRNCLGKLTDSVFKMTEVAYSNNAWNMLTEKFEQKNLSLITQLNKLNGENQKRGEK